ncbi:hypothetical protein H0H92_011974 [Tricholoma furcatifolium]|nr:hypothetical protein H0H92_011974 [Tricholoma furcatifolium]
MQTQVFTVEATSTCPFRTETIRFIPHESHEDGLTLLFFHAINLHKETFNLLITNLLNAVSPLKINDVWAIDNPNQGRSASLNRALLESEKYREKWSATEYAHAAHALLSTKSTGVDFQRRKLVGVAHSGGSTGLLSMMLLKLHKEITFEGLILLDPGILPPGRPSSAKLAGLFRKMALSKRDVWTSSDEACQDLSRQGAYRNFPPATFESFLAYYASDDMLLPPAEMLVSLSEEDKLPVHLIVRIKVDITML